MLPLWQHTSQTPTDCIQYSLAVCSIVQHHDQYLRWRLDDYRFTDSAQRAATGNW